MEFHGRFSTRIKQLFGRENQESLENVAPIVDDFATNNRPVLGPGTPFNLHCPLCESWILKGFDYMVTGREICKKCGESLYFVAKCETCGCTDIKCVREFAAYMNSGMACDRCDGVTRLQ